MTRKNRIDPIEVILAILGAPVRDKRVAWRAVGIVSVVLLVLGFILFALIM